MRTRLLTAFVAIVAVLTVFGAALSGAQAGASPTVTASLAATEPDRVPSYCLTSNPPPICWFFGDNRPIADVFDDVIVLDHVGGLLQRTGGLVGLIDPDAVDHVCLQPNPPRWCWLADLQRELEGPGIIIDDRVIVNDRVIINDLVIERTAVDRHLIDRVQTVGNRVPHRVR